MFVLLLVLQQDRAPEFNSTELAVKTKSERLGGSMVWCRPDEPDSSKPWVLSLDVDNKDRSFSFASVRPLKRLYALRVFQGTIEEASLAALKGLPDLQLLVFTSKGLSDRGMKAIGQCKSLRKLDVASDSLTSEGLKPLVPLRSLRRLFFYNTRLRSDDLEPLESMKFLDELVLPPTVGPARVQSLRHSLPRTRIERLDH
ncbi:MAG: hypothetical protein JSS66_17485 [Armatimonadetes bacterium]|nr:hypothetical protein [Armatimonadota bacterium]